MLTSNRNQLPRTIAIFANKYRYQGNVLKAFNLSLSIVKIPSKISDVVRKWTQSKLPGTVYLILKAIYPTSRKLFISPKPDF